VENKSDSKPQKASKHLKLIFKSRELKKGLLKDPFLEQNSSYIHSFLNGQRSFLQIKNANRKFYLSAQKKVQQDIIEAKTDDLSSKEDYLQELNNEKILDTVHDIKKLPETLIKCHDLKSFSFCQMLTHEKGNSTAQSYSNTNGQSELSVSLFNKTYQTIRKSKNNSFNSSSLNGSHLHLLGHFISVSFESIQFRWIVLLGNNDFFPSDENLEASVTKCFKKLSSKIENIFRHCRYDEKIENIILALDQSPTPIIIKDKRGNTIFKNLARDEVFENEVDHYGEKISSLRDGSEIFSLESRELQASTDIYHHYKVNLLGELLNTLRHELSNPLFGLHLSSEIMSGQSLDSESRELLEDIKNRAERCQTILKSFSKLYGDQEQSEVNIIEVINETMTLTKSETRGIKKELVSTLKPAQKLTTLHPTLLSQIIFNLIINASEALNEKSSIKSEIIVKCSHDVENYEISVIDNGPGVPEHLRSTIFDRFFTTKKEGTGLGLSICAGLIQKMNGSIKYSPRLDKKGSVFTIIF